MIYKMTIPGAKPVYVREGSKAKALEKLVEVESLTNDQLADVLESGEKLWKAGDKIEADTPAKPEAEGDDMPAERVNVETGMVEARDPGEAGKATGYVEKRPATIAELIEADPSAEAFRVEPKGGLVQRLPRQADPETGWEDIRAATPEEIAAAKKK